MSVLLHVPHASAAIPDDVRQRITLDDAALALELLVSTDHHTDAFVAGARALDVSGRNVRAHANALSRLVVDPERFLDPEREATEAVGRGAVYTRTVDGERLRDDTAADWQAVRADLIERYFAPHHAAMERHVAELVAASGTCTIVDVHSYPREVLPYELELGLDPRAPRPELCVGTDPGHTPKDLVGEVGEAAISTGLAVALDTPFAGTFVPTPWLGDPRVRSVMLEVRRDVYMDEETGRAHDGLARVQEFVTDVVRRILAGGAGVARPGS